MTEPNCSFCGHAPLEHRSQHLDAAGEPVDAFLYYLVCPVCGRVEESSVHLGLQHAVDVDAGNVWEVAIPLTEAAWQSGTPAVRADKRALWARLFAPDAQTMTPTQVAAEKGVTEQAVYSLLSDPLRKANFFPGAYFTGEGRRRTWHIPVDEVASWQPRQRR